MSLYLPNSKLLFFISAAMVSLLAVTLSLAPQNVYADQNDELDVKAKKILSEKKKIPEDKLKVVNKREALFQFSGKKSHNIKVVDDKGITHGVSLGQNGEELDYDTLVKENLEAKHAKYGKFDPHFFEKLSKEPEDKPVKAAITVKVPNYDPPTRTGGVLPDDGKNISLEQVEEQNKKEREQFNSHFQPVLKSAVEKLKAKGYQVPEDTDGAIALEVSFTELKEIQMWEEIHVISDDTINAKPYLADARPASGISEVNKRSFNNIPLNGTGVKVGVVEPGGYIDFNQIQTPDLPTTGITQDKTYSCTYASDHLTMVTGILKSTNLAHTGVATGSNVWVGSDCSGNPDNLYNITFDAVRYQNANIVNSSYGCNTTQFVCPKFPDGTTLKIDGLSFWDTHPSLVFAAGNDSGSDGDKTGNIYTRATGYNVITVGSYDDMNNNIINDDKVSDFSSWRNPTSFHNDREKPDVVAPGKDITSTRNTTPLFTHYGTSYSAPIVTGGSALLMQRSAYLKSEPEALKALLLATARKDVAKDGQIPYQDSKDGYGAVDFDWADKLLQGQISGQVAFNEHRCDTMPGSFTIPMSVVNTNPYRAVFTWRVNTFYPDYSNQPNMDFDINVLDPTGNSIASSATWDNNVEAVYFNPTTSGTYNLVVNRYRCDSPYTYTRYAAAWSQVPQYKAEYFNNKTLTGSPLVTRREDLINNDWGFGTPDPALPIDGFSARWTKTEHFNAGIYEFTATVDDGVRLYVDGVKILDKWIDQGTTTYKVSRSLTAGNHTIKYEYYDNVYGAVAKLSYEPITPIVSGGIYRLVNECGGKVLDVSGGSTANGANIQQWAWANVPQQKWKVESTTGGNYKFTAQHSLKVADVDNGSMNDGGNVLQWSWSSGTNQQWKLAPTSSNFYKVLNLRSGKALDVSNASIYNGGNVQQWADAVTCAQRWRFDKL